MLATRPKSKGAHSVGRPQSCITAAKDLPPPVKMPPRRPYRPELPSEPLLGRSWTIPILKAATITDPKITRYSATA
jgi:hypothetical protein